MSAKRPNLPIKTVRCAIYTRKSTEEGLQQDFNTLDAQRESAEAFIAAQKHEGWVCLPDRYDDGGFTGGNMDRPAVARLLADISAGRVDCVVVYKVDRLSRSLLDFARMMEIFEKNRVSFVSVTQQFNTTHSMGRLTLNILLSFAQFEREIISERTRDKIAAARRKGKFAGGKPLLGYDIVSSPGGSKLVVNGREARRVREIFELFLECGSIIPTVKELARRGWVNKRWQSKAGGDKGGKPFDKPTLYRMLGNVVYLGKIVHHEHIYAGEHEAIVPQALFDRVQAMLRRNKHAGGKHVRNKSNALLRGLVRCASCGTAMSHHFTSKNQNVRYRYYVCQNAQKRGWSSCPSASVPAAALEAFVVEQVREIGQNPIVYHRVMHAAQEQITDAIDALKARHGQATGRVKTLDAELRELAPRAGQVSDGADRLVKLQDDLRQAEQEVAGIGSQIIDMERKLVDDDRITQAIEAFDPMWDSLSPAEQASVVQMLVQQVNYDGQNETVSVVFRSNGIEQPQTRKEAVA